jgi:hypothetical protein
MCTGLCFCSADEDFVVFTPEEAYFFDLWCAKEYDLELELVQTFV